MGYDVRPVATDRLELEAVSRLLRSVWPHGHHSPEYLEWLYAANPSGQVIGFNAWHSESLTAHYAVIPIEARVYGEPVRAALSLNTAVHPNHQGRGLFTKLAARTYAGCEERGVHHVVGVANTQSTPGFVRRLGFDLLRPLDAWALWRLPKKAAPDAHDPPSWSRSWETGALGWRLANPARRYAVTASRGHTHVLAPTGRRGLRAILKIDSRAPETVAYALPRTPVGSPVLWMGASSTVRLSRLEGFRLPGWFRRSPLNLIVRYLAAGARPIDAAGIEFEAIDFDAY